MNPIKWLFKILAHFGLMDSEDFAKTRSEALDWFDNIRTDEEYEKALKEKKIDSSVKKTPIALVKLKKWFDNWYAKVLLAVSFIFVVRWIKDYMSGFKEDEVGSDLDDDL